jgi:hypothetical protein
MQTNDCISHFARCSHASVARDKHAFRGPSGWRREFQKIEGKVRFTERQCHYGGGRCKSVEGESVQRSGRCKQSSTAAGGASEAVGRSAPGEEQIVNAAERIPYCPEAESDRKRSSDDLLVIAVVYCIDHVGRRWHAVSI